MSPVLALAQIAALAGAAGGGLTDALVLGPKWAGAPRLRVAPVEAELDCTAADRDDACAFHVRLRVTTRDAAPAHGAFFAAGARDVVVEVDGSPALPGVAAPTELDRFEEGFRGPSFVAPGDADPEEAIPFVVPPAAAGATERHEIVLRGRVRLVALVRTLSERVTSSEALVARHPLFGVPAPRRAAGLVVVAPVRGIDAVRSPAGLRHHGVVTARSPTSWTLEGRGDRACPLAVTGLGACGAPDVVERASADGRIHVRYATPLGTHLVLGVRAETPPSPVAVTRGGPSLAAGYAFGMRDGFRGRLGYDAGLGASGAWIGSLGVESDLARRVEVVPLVLFGSRARLLRPSVGVGVGAPVSLLPDPGVSGRLRLDVTWAGVGLETHVDVHAAPAFGATVAALATGGL